MTTLRTLRRMAIVAAVMPIAAACNESPTAPIEAGSPAPAAAISPAGSNAGNGAVVDQFRSTGPFSIELRNPCALDGEGEWVLLTGTEKIRARRVENPAGGMQDVFTVRLSNLRGVGETTGDEYITHGGVSDAVTVGRPPYSTTASLSVHMISRGKGADFYYSRTVRLMFVDNGEPRFEIVNERGACR